MKKILSLFLLFVMLLSLCACSENEVNNTNSAITSDCVSTEKTDEPISSTTDNESEVIESSTTTPSEGEDVITSQPVSSKDDEVSVEKPLTPPTKEPASTSSENVKLPAEEATTSTTTSSAETPTTKPSSCEHTYTTLTCSCPKYCTKCEDIAANALPHNYQNGKCTVCGWSEIAFNIKEGNWVANIVKTGTAEQGEVLSQYILTQNQYVGAIVCYSNANSCIANYGKVNYNGKTYYVDYYYLTFTSVDWEENGDTITVTSRGGESSPRIVLTKMSETQLIVIDSNSQAYIPVGTVLEKQ